MREYCAEALKYGDEPQAAHQRFEQILVILNPTADKRSSTNTVIIKKQQNYSSILLFTRLLGIFIF